MVLQEKWNTDGCFLWRNEEDIREEAAYLVYNRLTNSATYEIRCQPLSLGMAPSSISSETWLFQRAAIIVPHIGSSSPTQPSIVMDDGCQCGLGLELKYSLNLQLHSICLRPGKEPYSKPKVIHSETFNWVGVPDNSPQLTNLRFCHHYCWTREGFRVHRRRNHEFNYDFVTPPLLPVVC